MASLGDWEGVLDSFLQDMETLDHVQEVTVHVASPKLEKQIPKEPKVPTWLRRKHELQSLRQQAAAMETRVMKLQNKRSAAGATMDGSLARTDALVERKRRKDVQDENERLRKNLEAYARQANALQSFSDGEGSHQDPLMHRSVPVTTALRVEVGVGQRLRFSGHNVFGLLQARMDARLRELEEAFTLMKLPMGSTDSNLVETTLVGAVEFARIQLLPFRNTDISSALWSVVEIGGFPDGEDSVVTRLSRDTYAVNSHVRVHLESGGTIDINSSSLLKRFDAPSGVVVLVESNSAWTADHPVTGTWCHRTREGGCISMCDHTSPGISQTRSMLRLTPVAFTGQDLDCPLAASQMIKEVVIPSFRELVISRHQFVENALFDIIRSRTRAS
ncbi:uncharacterized protein IUM83_01303 [Phytophthora cinnamomi]|uniref:uncharacterized protein n=1 Tax=Phytophthora cinnamomi TaxID=4785 RepID=UPI00355A1E18|nr:hypothetical protein IUM83_01303 [Phytophthora cinnamomi]